MPNDRCPSVARTTRERCKQDENHVGDCWAPKAGSWPGAGTIDEAFKEWLAGRPPEQLSTIAAFLAGWRAGQKRLTEVAAR
jgi:hypothetical protein